MVCVVPCGWSCSTIELKLPDIGVDFLILEWTDPDLGVGVLLSMLLLAAGGACHWSLTCLTVELVDCS